MNTKTIQNEIQRICNEMVDRYQRENTLLSWTEEKMFGNHKISGVKERIKELLINGYKIKGGYRCTSIRDYHSHYIYYKKLKT